MSVSGASSTASVPGALALPMDASSQELVAWFGSFRQDFSAYAEAALRNGVTARDVYQATFNQLNEALAITSVGHKRVFKNQVVALRKQAIGSVSPSLASLDSVIEARRSSIASQQASSHRSSIVTTPSSLRHLHAGGPNPARTFEPVGEGAESRGRSRASSSALSDHSAAAGRRSTSASRSTRPSRLASVAEPAGAPRGSHGSHASAASAASKGTWDSGFASANEQHQPAGGPRAASPHLGRASQSGASSPVSHLSRAARSGAASPASHLARAARSGASSPRLSRRSSAVDVVSPAGTASYHVLKEGYLVRKKGAVAKSSKVYWFQIKRSPDGYDAQLEEYEGKAFKQALCLAGARVLANPKKHGYFDVVYGKTTWHLGMEQKGDTSQDYKDWIFVLQSATLPPNQFETVCMSAPEPAAVGDAGDGVGDVVVVEEDDDWV